MDDLLLEPGKKIQQEAQSMAGRCEPMLASFFHSTILTTGICARR